MALKLLKISVHHISCDKVKKNSKMLITEKSLFFIHIPKTGGTSISKAFDMHANPVEAKNKAVLRHCNLSACQKYCKDNNIDEPKNVFHIARNRYDQLVSTWRWYLRGTKYKRHSINEYSFMDYLKNINLIFQGNIRSRHHQNIRGNMVVNIEFHKKMEGYYFKGTRLFNSEDYYLLDYRHIAPLEWWTNNDPKVIPIRLENLQEDFDSKIASLANMRNTIIKTYNANNKVAPYTLKKSEAAIIYSLYSKEIERFCYMPSS